MKVLLIEFGLKSLFNYVMNLPINYSIEIGASKFFKRTHFFKVSCALLALNESYRLILNPR